MSKLNQQQDNLKKILWFALFASNFMMAIIAWFNFMDMKGSIVLYEGLRQLPYVLACMLALISYGTFYFATNENRLREQFKKLSTELALNSQMTPQMYDEFKAMSDKEKKKYILNTKILTFMVLSWSLAEAVNIIGMMSIYMFGMDANHYYVLLGISVFLMLITYPKEIRLPSH